MKTKSPLQYEALERFYAEEKYPTHQAMEELAAVLDLTYKQVRGWFAEKRRRDKNKNILIVPPRVLRKLAASKEKARLGVTSADRKILKRKGSSVLSKPKSSVTPSQMNRYKSSGFQKRKKFGCLQVLRTPQNILGKVFRKDGPPLGVEFDSVPSRGFCSCKGSKGSRPACQVHQRENKRRKVSEHATLDCQDNSSPMLKHGMGKSLMTVWRATYPIGGNFQGPPPLCQMSQRPTKHTQMKHGMGKGLITVWRATNPDGADFPPGFHSIDRQYTQAHQISNPTSRKPKCQTRKRQPLASLLKRRMQENKLLEKRKASIKRGEVESKKEERDKQLWREKCELALDEVISQERLSQFEMLVDDEELELSELQSGSNTVTCSDHCSSNRLHSCALCKDSLSKFPPSSVKMKQPFATQPWDSSPDAIKKLFKVFHFLYTHAVSIDICLFTLDEFAQAFHDKDSVLLGKIHIALLRLLFSDIETEISAGCLPNPSISCKFLALIHSIEDQESVIEFWKKSLNPLTWTEILRQVLVAAGFESKKDALHREARSKEMIFMAKYGLRPGTLKGELFKLLLEQQNTGLKVSDLGKSIKISELKLASTTEKLEILISSTLSSDITLFEKISRSTYRLRNSTLEMENDEIQSDSEYSGSVHDEFSDDGSSSNSESECDSPRSNSKKLARTNHHKSKSNTVKVDHEIDESHPGEVWLLGLMEGEYSDLSVVEKLNALVALVDLVSAGSSVRMEDLSRATAECVRNSHHRVSGGKIKRSSSKQHHLPRPSWVHGGRTCEAKEGYMSSKLWPVDSSVSMSKSNGGEKFCGQEKDANEVEVAVNLCPHSMQSIFLGSDRRFSRYWLFLGPCNVYDPGHKRVYFESSEDGHWEVIDTEEALRALLSLLDGRGKREAHLIESLEKREAFLCQEMSSRILSEAEVRCLTKSDQSGVEGFSPVSDVDNSSLNEIAKDSTPAIILEAEKKGKEEDLKWNHLQEFDAWIWNYFYCNLNAVKRCKRSYLESLARCETCHDLYWRDEKHCKICHTTFELDFDLEERYAIHSATCRDKHENTILPKHKVLSSQLQSLKAAIHAIESIMPEDALVGAWTKSAHRLWVKRLRRTSSVVELLQVVGDFVAAINDDWLYECSVDHGSNTFMMEITACFPSMPQTSSALALWIVKLDDLISPYLGRVQHQEKNETKTKCTGNRVPEAICPRLICSS